MINNQSRQANDSMQAQDVKKRKKSGKKKRRGWLKTCPLMSLAQRSRTIRPKETPMGDSTQVWVWRRMLTAWPRSGSVVRWRGVLFTRTPEAPASRGRGGAGARASRGPGAEPHSWRRLRASGGRALRGTGAAMGHLWLLGTWGFWGLLLCAADPRTGNPVGALGKYWRGQCRHNPCSRGRGRGGTAWHQPWTKAAGVAAWCSWGPGDLEGRPNKETGTETETDRHTDTHMERGRNGEEREREIALKSSVLLLELRNLTPDLHPQLTQLTKRLKFGRAWGMGDATWVLLLLTLLGSLSPLKWGKYPSIGQEWVFVASVSHFQGQLPCAFKVIPRRGLGRDW